MKVRLAGATVASGVTAGVVAGVRVPAGCSSSLQAESRAARMRNVGRIIHPRHVKAWSPILSF
jgi:hypothetical protein